ncbi:PLASMODESMATA CALLOSE-BINDING PROTEIN 3 [Abeliophyllum distichum]|uniref:PLASMODESMATA CALLOSE-BINDING PROTEIN 3 n=1 Tax=Abeliophyllum distichum TaxID=126358 RepID=A0ABD1VZU0_9LAMI
MAVFAVCLVVLLAITSHSDATYCICKDGVSDSLLQKNIDYACGAAADCTPILQNGPCFNPNTVKDHCHYAVNSYFQRKGQTAGSCDFSGTATVSQIAPNAASGCVYPSSPSNAGTSTTTPSNTPIIGGTPNTGIPTTTNTPTTTGGTPTTGFPTTVPGTTTGPGIGLGPTGSGSFNDNSASATLFQLTTLFMCLVFSSFLLRRGA